MDCHAIFVFLPRVKTAMLLFKHSINPEPDVWSADQSAFTGRWLLAAVVLMSESGRVATLNLLRRHFLHHHAGWSLPGQLRPFGHSERESESGHLALGHCVPAGIQAILSSFCSPPGTYAPLSRWLRQPIRHFVSACTGCVRHIHHITMVHAKRSASGYHDLRLRTYLSSRRSDPR